MGEPFTVATLTTLIGLIATYKQLGDGRKSSESQDFVLWLTEHRFTEISEQIARSFHLQASLGELLREDQGQLMAKLETIEDVVRSVASKLDGFSALEQTMDHSEYLSEQACEFLRQLNTHESGQVYCEIDQYGCEVAFLPIGSGAFYPPEPRFFPDDLEKLNGADWISIATHNGTGPTYRITRRGAAAAQRLKKQE